MSNRRNREEIDDEIDEEENDNDSDDNDSDDSGGERRPSRRRSPRPQSGRPDRRGRRRGRNVEYCPEGRCFDYKDVDTLRRYVNETGKIRPRRQTGNCARCQRSLAREIKRARHLALLPFVNLSE
ncbi:MAG: 30S ribosomal protein S18 [Anaerolineae bacterium]|nr:30S ribosomal protein S18 [Anaerolineae bacterium]